MADDKALNSYAFKNVYDDLNIDMKKLYAVMLNVEAEYPKLPKEIELYKSDELSWVNGYVAKEEGGHLTMLYGILDNDEVKPEHVQEVLGDWNPGPIIIKEIAHFEDHTKGEYYCIVAHIDITEKLLEGHQRCSFLPHINTFPQYKAHVTLAYIKKDDAMLKQATDIFTKHFLKNAGINKRNVFESKEVVFDNNSGDPKTITIF